MVKIFDNNQDYINCYTALDINSGGVICTSYLPSAFFQKDVIDYYFSKKEPLNTHHQAADDLWDYGKKVIKGVKTGSIQLCIELEGITNFIEKGIVHQASQNFEVSFPTRLHVLEQLLVVADKIVVSNEPLPYVFRLVPNSIILIDVRFNRSSQLIQGMLIDDLPAYQSFALEFDRIKSMCMENNKEGFEKQIKSAISQLKNGQNYKWKR